MKEIAIEVGFRVLYALILAAIAWALSKWAGARTTADQRATVLSYVRTAVGYAEEAARRQLKLGNVAMQGTEKLQMAMNLVRQLAGELVKGIKDEELRAIIEGELPTFRAETQVVADKPATAAP